MSHKWATQRPISLKPLNKAITPSPNLLTPRKAGYLFFLLAICLSLNIFRLSSPPLCTSDRPLPSDRQIITELFRSISKLPRSKEEFWRQPDGLGYRPCLNFSKEYQRAPTGVAMKRRRYLMAVVSGGLNQQRNQIIDAVVIARILDAVLVLPILQFNLVWGDESEFSDIFDDRHFKETLKDDVHVVSSLPASHLRKRPVTKTIMPLNIDETWVRTQFMGRINKDGVLILRGFDSRLSKDLNSDLQKLRCKVAFHALKFRAWIEELGQKLAKRMGNGGPFLALHLRLEKDVWVRTGCLPGLGKDADRSIKIERAAHPELLTSRSNFTARHRYISGQCPLNAVEISRLLIGLGAPESMRIYWAGGDPYGGEMALEPLRSNFAQLYNKWSLADAGELDRIKHKSSVLAAIDYVVCLKSSVFMANHGGNMARSIQGQRAFAGHRKYITPNKKGMVELSMNKSLDEREMKARIKMMHLDLSGSPLLRTGKLGRDVIAFPVPDCMCTRENSRS
ncbi:O-fucosyltransferase 20-like [Tasmannia lanceolata]|uniref:O-fucosyltransferase 20-like n=1 Tax=Tasmannia lanceolata TaxID=3420 RepID=UPI00406387E6